MKSSEQIFSLRGCQKVAGGRSLAQTTGYFLTALQAEPLPRGGTNLIETGTGARLTALGVQVHITEMDVALPLDPTGSLLDQADLARQADIYRFVATACIQQTNCTALQTWGFTDKYSWIPRYTKGAKGKALLFDQTYAPKPAYNALLEVLERERPGKTSSGP